MRLFLFLFVFCISAANARAPDGFEEVNCISLNKNHKNYIHHLASCVSIQQDLNKIQWSWSIDNLNNSIDLKIYTPDLNFLCYLNIYNANNQVIRKYKLNRRTFFANQEFREKIYAPTLSSFVNQVSSAKLEPCEFYAFLNYPDTTETSKKIDHQNKQTYSSSSTNKTTASKQTTNSLGKELLKKVFK